MRLKLYRAASMVEAMASVRTELGADALILATRRVSGGVEVTAAVEPEHETGSSESVDAGRMAALAAPFGNPPGMPPRPKPTALDLALLAGRRPVVPVRGVRGESGWGVTDGGGNGEGEAACAPNGRAEALRFHGVPTAVQAALRQGVPAERLRAILRFGTLDVAIGAPPLLLAGPPGAGKTLTIAKLATRLVMAGTPPLVLTADGQRAGAAEQLAAFTRLLGLSLIVASNPLTIGRAMARRAEGMPVLIDTPGLDPFDPAQRDALAALVATAGAAMALVLPAGLDPGESADLAGAFAEMGASPLIATRLDLARRIGGVVAAAATAPLVLTEAGIGPGAANGLTPLTAAFLADRLLAGPPGRTVPPPYPERRP